MVDCEKINFYLEKWQSFIEVRDWNSN